MGEVKRYSPKVRQRAIRMAVDRRGEYPSQWAAIQSAASRLSMIAETLRHWVERAGARSTRELVLGSQQMPQRGCVRTNLRTKSSNEPMRF